MPETSPLRSHDLHELCQIDERQLRKELVSDEADNQRIRVAQVPDVETMRWHHAREEFVADEMLDRKPDIKGAIAVDSTGRRAWCIWTRMWSGEDAAPGPTSTLYILRLVFEQSRNVKGTPEDSPRAGQCETLAAALLLAARREAAFWQMDEVHIWNPSSVVQAAARRLARLLPESLRGENAGIIHREDDSITCLNWDSSGYPTLAGKTWSDVDWVANEKFAWC